MWVDILRRDINQANQPTSTGCVQCSPIPRSRGGRHRVGEIRRRREREIRRRGERERLGDGEKDRKRLRDGKREDVRREEKRLGEIKRN